MAGADAVTIAMSWRGRGGVVRWSTGWRRGRRVGAGRGRGHGRRTGSRRLVAAAMSWLPRCCRCGDRSEHVAKGSGDVAVRGQRCLTRWRARVPGHGGVYVSRRALRLGVVGFALRTRCCRCSGLDAARSGRGRGEHNIDEGRWWGRCLTLQPQRWCLVTLAARRRRGRGRDRGDEDVAVGHGHRGAWRRGCGCDSAVVVVVASPCVVAADGAESVS